ncbi:MAG TPA: FAD-binding oxidoreductase [candidate division Zixibacteria bacterium]|nr:FAD-binding oxidoreductase [candidate division Zixibacteria bacterium]
MALPVSSSVLNLERVRAGMDGRVIAPEDPDYDEVRRVLPGDIDRRPAVIVRAANDQDVARTVLLARETGLELAVRAGGHSAGGFGAVEGGIVLDLRDLRALEIDPELRFAWAGGGMTAGEYTSEAGRYGLATGFGDTASVGIGGLTTGGGIGYLVRKHGLTIDSLLAADVVTADGELIRVDAESHPDLFWAIRGGGGNFGVVTRFGFRLHPVDQFVGGILVLPATPDVIAGFMAEAEAAPDELSTIANIMPSPPMPFVPEEKHGSLVLMAMMAWAGDVKAGQQIMGRFRALAEPIADLVRPMTYPEIYPPNEGAEEFHPLAVARIAFKNRVDRKAAETILQYLEASDAPMRAVQLRVLGGAMARVPADATAFAHRSSPIMVAVASFYAGPEDRPKRRAWVDDLSAALDDGAPGAYVNFVGDEGPERVRDAYPGTTYDRLARIKARYDPDNLFRHNVNVPPAG